MSDETMEPRTFEDFRPYLKACERRNREACGEGKNDG